MKYVAQIVVQEDSGLIRTTFPFPVELDRAASEAPLTIDEQTRVYDAFVKHGDIGQIDEVRVVMRERPKQIKYALQLDRSVS